MVIVYAAKGKDDEECDDFEAETFIIVEEGVELMRCSRRELAHKWVMTELDRVPVHTYFGMEI